MAGPVRSLKPIARICVMPQPDDSAPFWKREFHLDLRPLVRWVREHPELTIVILGVVVRLIDYWWNRAMWLDEMSLRGNVVNIGILDFSKPLWNDQLAPMGFLIVERAMATFLSGRNYVLRSLPMAASLGALFLFRRVATEIVPRRAVLVALMLFAFSDDLVYYASEFKPYALDLFFGLAITLQALAVLGRAPSHRDVARMIFLLAVSPWFSFSSAFVVAGCGLVLLGDALTSRQFRIASLWLVMGVGWLANFYVSYRASQSMLNPYTTMFYFWDFAFIPPTRGGLLKTADLLLEVFVNPLNLLTVPGYRAGAVIPLFLLCVGAVSMARRSLASSSCSTPRSRWRWSRRSHAAIRSTGG